MFRICGNLKKSAISTHLRFTIGFCVMLYMLQFYMITQPKVLKYLILMCILALISVSELSLSIFFLCLQMFRRPQMVFVLCCSVTAASPVFLFLTPFRPPLVRGWLMSVSPPR